MEGVFDGIVDRQRVATGDDVVTEYTPGGEPGISWIGYGGQIFFSFTAFTTRTICPQKKRCQVGFEGVSQSVHKQQDPNADKRCSAMYPKKKFNFSST